MSLKDLIEARVIIPILEPGEWQLHCVECGFMHDKMTAARPFCDDCGSRLYLSKQPTTIALPKIAIRSDLSVGSRVVCVNDDYLAALEEMMKGGKIDGYLQGFLRHDSGQSGSGTV